MANITARDEEDELLDAAFDEAEEELENKAEEPEEPATTEPAAEPEAEKPTEDEPAAEPAAAEPAAKDAATTQEPSPAPTTAGEGEPVSQAPSGSLVVDPPMWSAQDKALLAKAPREVQEIIARKEQQRNEWVNKITRESEQGRAILKRTHDVLSEHAAELQEIGVKDHYELMKHMLGWNSAFRKEPKTAIEALMRQANLTPQDFFGEVNGEYVDYNQQSDPRVEEALAEAQEAKRLAEEFRGMIEQERYATQQAEIEQFRNGTDSQGQPRARFAQLYKDQIADMCVNIMSQYPGTPMTQALDQAYETVLSQARAAFGLNRGAPRSNGVQAAKAQAAAGSVSGGPRTGTSKKPTKRYTDKDLDKVIQESMDELGL